MTTELVESGYEIWFTPPPDTMIGIVLQNGIACIYLRSPDEESKLIATLPPQINPVILDDFTRDETLKQNSGSWTIEESLDNP